MSALDQLRKTGLPMVSRYAPMPYTDPETERTGTVTRYYSRTTDEAKADAARELDATVSEYRSAHPKFSGWEVLLRVVEWDEPA